MYIKLSHKMIKEMCGIVSFKRGDAFYRANKVIIKHENSESCEAVVTGIEDFHVTIHKNNNGSISTKCSCPKLASYQKDCQHIASVLIAIYEKQRHGNMITIDPSAKVLSNGLLTIFDDRSLKSSAKQLHFENRQLLDVMFLCKPVSIGNGKYLFGIELKIGSIIVQNIRSFLEHVHYGSVHFLSASFTYDPNVHCFQRENDEVIRLLIQIIQDEQVYTEALMDHHILLIPPSSWENLFSLLEKAPSVKLEVDGNLYDRIEYTKEPLPIRFDFDVDNDHLYKLKIEGHSRMIVFHPYSAVLYDGKLIKLESDDCKRLLDLKKMLEGTGTNQIPIPNEQVGFFLDKVVPGLNKLGDVRISETISIQNEKTPLIAKLYLDRLKSRLLAGLEFHYENIVINPLESRKLETSSILIRDTQKENAILDLMEESSFTKTEEGYFLHNEELEYQFLHHIVPKLQSLVQIYATTAVRNRIFKGNTHPQIRVKVKKERTNWLEFKFEMDGIPEKQIREVLQALEEKRKYYRLRNGSLLSLETREFEEIKRFLQAQPVQTEDLIGGIDVPIVKGLRFLDSEGEGHAFTFEESFQKFIDNLRKPGEIVFEVPKDLRPILRDYQKRGYQWMRTLANFGFGGILADDMGLGKTLQSITYILSVLPEIRNKKMPALVVCPSSLTYNWLSEMMKFTQDIHALVVDGKPTDRFELLKNLSNMDVLIISYPLLRKDIKWLEKQTFHTVFFDEAQNFKNPLTQTARSVTKIKANHLFALTGTPVENSLEELWSIFHVVFPELFQGLKEYSHLSKKAIARRIQPFLLRRVKEEVLSELPEKNESIETVDLLPDQKKLYAAYLAKLRHDTLKHLNKDTLRKNKIKILAGLTRLRQICCHPALFVDGYKGNSAKFEQLMQILEESRHAGRRVLVFSQFTKMLELIGRELAYHGQPYFYLDGQTPAEERVQLCNRFNNGERDLFLISLKAGGTGLNLTGADTVVLYDLWWNPAVEEQAADRAHRIGQTNVVQVIKLVSKGTIEEKMNELQEKKRQLIDEIIYSEEKASSTLTEEDIREILMI